MKDYNRFKIRFIYKNGVVVDGWFYKFKFDMIDKSKNISYVTAPDPDNSSGLSLQRPIFTGLEDVSGIWQIDAREGEDGDYSPHHCQAKMGTMLKRK